MTQPSVLILDEITRIYKNSIGRVIGIHCIHVHETRKLIPSGLPNMNDINKDRFKRGSYLTVSFDRFNLQMGESRVIDKIQMIGKYDDFTYNGNSSDIISVKYISEDPNINDVIVSLRDFPTIGESI